MISKAFLSHATADKTIVRAVAEILGRAAVIYDEYDFRAGDQLKRAILDGIGRAELFVLFASRSSLERDWVKFEITEAERAHGAGHLKQFITFIIDDTPTELIPNWMQSTLIVRKSSPNLIATDIQQILSEKLAEARPRHFVGRNLEMEQLLDHITSMSGVAIRPPIVVYGLSGIGRRSLIEVVARNNLSYPRVQSIKLSEGDSLADFAFKLAVFIEGPPAEGVEDLQDAIEALTRPDQISVIMNNLKALCQSGILPVIYDLGAMALEDGTLSEFYTELYQAISLRIDIDVLIVANRRLYLSNGVSIPTVRVPELPPLATQRLVRLLTRDRNVPITDANVSRIVEYSRGYPPAVMYALQEMQIYGAEHVAANAAALTKFSEQIFLTQLKKDQKISRNRAEILRLTSNYSPLPLSVIKGYVNPDSSEGFFADVSYLVDFAFIIPDGLRFRISDPVRVAAYRAFNGMGIDHGKVAHLLDNFLELAEDETADLDIGQHLFRASSHAGMKTPKRAVRLASDIIDMATQAYHDQDYDRAIELGLQSVSMRPDSLTARRYLAQALIRRERYVEATQHIDDILRIGSIKEAFYIRGFMARRKRHYTEAIDHYRKSLEYGRKGIAIHRELASCYFEIGDWMAAEKELAVAELDTTHNPFIVDLKCMIAIRRGNLSAAEMHLAILERVDKSGFFEHRRSTFEQASGNPREALRYALLAMQAHHRPPFEMVGNLANCYIEVGEYEEAAATLSQLSSRFPSSFSDAQLGLRCKLEIRRGDLEVAETLWRQMRDHDTPVHLGLRASLLKKKASIFGLSDSEHSEMSVISSRQGDSDTFERLLGSVELFEDKDEV
jgi:tetratricopeptide (TPR) repeat protein